MKEKLIELHKVLRKSLHCNYDEFQDAMTIDTLITAENLIANGVTIQKWIPLSEQKPDRDTLVIVFFEGMRDTPAAIQIMYGWCIGGSASHWMPLPEIPKGV